MAGSSTAAVGAAEDISSGAARLLSDPNGISVTWSTVYCSWGIASQPRPTLISTGSRNRNRFPTYQPIFFYNIKISRYQNNQVESNHVPSLSQTDPSIFYSSDHICNRGVFSGGFSVWWFHFLVKQRASRRIVLHRLKNHFRQSPFSTDTWEATAAILFIVGIDPLSLSPSLPLVILLFLFIIYKTSRLRDIVIGTGMTSLCSRPQTTVSHDASFLFHISLLLSWKFCNFFSFSVSRLT